MKKLTTILAVLLAMACLSIAQAQTVLRITGSTAYRGNTHNAIKNVFDANSLQYGYVGASFTGASQAIFKGTIGGQAITVKTAWSGSEGGIQTVAGQVAIAFLPDTTAVSSGGTPNATAATTANGGDVAVPDVAMSDTYQSSSAYFGLYKGKTYPTLTESPNSPVGVVPFKFLASKGAPAGLTNITSQQARALFGAGALPLALFTGVNADEGTTVVATGRDPDSGTRLTTFAEVGLGPQATVKQYQPSDASGNLIKTAGGSIAKFIPWPASTINGIPVAVFNGGYSSGGQLALALGNTTPSGFVLLSYAGVSDADGSALPNGAVELSYNGVKLGAPAAGQTYNNLPALTEGQYTFWGYEHMYYRSGTASDVVKAADTIANQLKTTDAQVLLSNMKVTRSTDGAVVLPNYNTTQPPQ